MKCGRKPKTTTDKSRITDNIKIAKNGCWIWAGLKYKAGISCGHKILPYGRLKFRGKSTTAHCVSWIVFRGEIPHGKKVCHGCDNPPCANPDHLFLGTNKTNVEDCRKKKRHSAGERHPKHKLTRRMVKAIRKKYKAWDRRFSLRALAKKYGVSQTIIYRAVKGKWGYR